MYTEAAGSRRYLEIKHLGYFVEKVGLHGLHFLWFTFIYLNDNQIVNFYLCHFVGLHCKPSLGPLRGTRGEL